MKKIKTEIVILAVLVILSLIVRFYNFAGRITFGPEQAISLLVSADYINDKFSLLGLPSTQRTTSQGHIIFYPPVFNYSLIPLILIFNYKVIPVTAYFAILNVATGILVFFLTRKFFGKNAGLFASAVFLFNDLMIYHSLFIWSVNYLPFLGILIFYLCIKIFKKKAVTTDNFILGILAGLSFGVEYLYLVTGFLLFIFLIIFSKKRLISLILFLAGGLLSLLPTVIFDINHGFYHLKTLWQYFLDTLFLPSQSKITYYHFLYLWPVGSVALGILLAKIYSKSKFPALILAVLIICLGLFSSRVSFSSPVGMYPDLNYGKIENAANIISQDNPQDFNVVMTFDFDSRAHPLRYLLRYNHGFKPLGVEDYPNARNLYVFTVNDYPLKTTSLWEISSFGGSSDMKLGGSGGFAVYKILK